MDLGACPKMHSERLKSEYEEAKKRKECDYESEFERSLANFVADCDRKIASAQKRLDKTPEEHTSELQSRSDLVCRLLLEKKKRRSHQKDERGSERRADIEHAH